MDQTQSPEGGFEALDVCPERNVQGPPTEPLPAYSPVTFHLHPFLVAASEDV